MSFFLLLLLLLVGNLQRADSQSPGWTEEVEGSGKTSYEYDFLYIHEVLLLHNGNS